MAKQKFSAIERQAIWLAHGGKCAYTGQLLDLRNMHIDHVLPEHLIADTQAFTKLKVKLGLPMNFDLMGFENLLPAAPGINLQKHGNTFSETQIQFFLGIAGAKKEIIERSIKKFESQLESGKAAIIIQGLIERGKITAQEATSIFQKYYGNAIQVFKLLESLNFLNGEEVNTLEKSEINDLRKRVINLGFEDEQEGLSFVNEANESRLIKTCEEYDNALKDGFFAPDNWTMVMAINFEHQCGLLNALSKATMATTSYISEPRFGIADIELIPYKLFPHFEESVSSDISYQDKVLDGELVIKRIGTNFLVVEDKGCMGQQLIEVARADFNGDGIEDILLFNYSYAIGGTMRFGGTMILTRKSQTEKFELIN